MKKFLIGLLIVLLAGTAYAERNNIQKLRVDKAVMDSYAFTSGTIVTSDSISTKGNTGFAVLVVDFDALGGDLDIDMEVSLDNVTFYSPHTTNGTSLTDAGGVVDTLAADDWIILNAKLANWVRFEFDPDSTCTVDSLYMMYQEDN